MLKSVVLASVAVASLTAFATGASAQSSQPVMSANQQANEAFIVQRNNTGGNSATVEQSGTNNKAGRLFGDIDLSVPNLSDNTLSATANTAYTVLQNGSSNTLFITQAGSNNSIRTTNGNVFNNPSIGVDNGSFQQGNDNFVDSKQSGSNGVAQFQQNGDRNQARITVENQAQNTYAGIFQTNGVENIASINQNYNSNNAYAAIFQIGSNNNAGITQNGNTNYAGLLQSGNHNTANIEQTGSYIGTVGYQSGSYNTASVTQSGTSANAGFAQFGSGNGVTIRQR
ncbi:hypothetical protein CTI14_08030 [Methylobacterium radiotolerans]|nr:hypothetical protein CTI14_08030 [Methylobacterium radiotolerans]